MKTKWMLDDDHECPLSSHVHRADADCVAYARKHGDRTFLDHCGGAAYSGSGGPPEQCSLEALHDGRCKP